MQQLPPSTIRLLSSSQSISSVVNVVKELVENSLDANATSIEVKLENNGFDRIEVRDNGDGIKAVDTPVMGLKHYTSKITHHEDLEALETYGFRGEALASICAVSEVIVTTKTGVDEVSTQYTLDSAGHIISQKPSHMGQGTTVTVLKLFKNIPVRKQFYSTVKKCKDELKKVYDLLMAYGIIKPDVRIIFTHNKNARAVRSRSQNQFNVYSSILRACAVLYSSHMGRSLAVVWQKAKVSDHKMALLTVLGTAVMVSMVPIQHHEQEPEIFLSGFLPKPGSNPSSMSLTSPDRSFISVNSRPVQHKEILKLVRQYYSSQCQKDSSHIRYPIFFLNILVPASVIDVNLTPDKSQIMFHNKEAILFVIERVLISVYGQLDEPSPECLAETGLPSSGEAKKSGTSTSTETSLVADTVDMCPETITFSNNISEVVVDKKESFDGNIAKNKSKEIPSPANVESTFVPEFDVAFALDDDCILSKSQPDINNENAGYSSLVPVTLSEQISVVKDSNEPTADDWSKGVMKDSMEQAFAPVKLLVPKDTSGQDQVACDEKKQHSPTNNSNNNLSTNSSNVVQDKIGQITLYDLISNRTVKKSLPASALFIQEIRPKLLAENPRANLQDVSMKLEEMWKNLNEDEKKKYEDKAAKDLDRYNLQLKKAMEKNPHHNEENQPKLAQASKVAKKHKQNAPLSNQQILDKLFESQIHNKTSLEHPCKAIDVPFSLSVLKKQLEQLSKNHETGGERLHLINCLTSHNGWVVASEKRLMLLNPFRVEEALLFKRLMENHIFQTEILDTPVPLTSSQLGGPQYVDCLYNMQKESTAMRGITYFTDPRLVSNGFKIQLIIGGSTGEHHLEIQEMARCLPFYGISDLREILTAILNKNAQHVHQCRPLKVVNYLEGEAVRLARQLPLCFSREDIEDTLLRMQQELGRDCNSCIHGRPFLHHLASIPEMN